MQAARARAMCPCRRQPIAVSIEPLLCRLVFGVDIEHDESIARWRADQRERVTRPPAADYDRITARVFEAARRARGLGLEQLPADDLVVGTAREDGEPARG